MVVMVKGLSRLQDQEGGSREGLGETTVKEGKRSRLKKGSSVSPKHSAVGARNRARVNSCDSARSQTGSKL